MSEQTDILAASADPILGMTLADYAAHRGKHPQSLRREYSLAMRTAAGIALPAVSQQTEDEGTVKFCLPVPRAGGGGEAPQSLQAKQLETESVIIPMQSFGGKSWYSLCVSSQVGCRMGCTFCETGRMGLIRNLSAAEIVQQRVVARAIRTGGQASAENYRYFADGIQNIVFMGMGEPLDNFDNVVQAIRVLSDPAGLDFPQAQISVSTVGRVDGLRKLAALNWPNLRLAISLNAANDKLRDELMPINKGMPLAELQRALMAYPLAARARFLIEYVLIKDVNDSPADAEAVAAFCKPLRCVCNVIPYNPQRYAAYETPPEERIVAFVMRLKELGIFTKRRVTHGRDLMSACGQLGNPEIRRKSGLPVLRS